MKQEKICISKSVMIFAAVAVFLLGFVVFTNYLNGQKVGQKPKADEPNPVHVPLESRKINCPVVGEKVAWKQTDNPPTYYANTGVCAGSDDPAKVYDGTGNFQVCCNEQITFNEYMKLNNLPLSISCPKDRPIKYEYGPQGERTNCYKINGKVLWEGTVNQTCGNLEMPFTDCCEKSTTDACQGVTPTAAPTVAPTEAPTKVTELKCPPTSPYVYEILVGKPGTNFSQSGCYLKNGKLVVDPVNGSQKCDWRKMEGWQVKCCGVGDLSGCQPSNVTDRGQDR